MRLLARRELMMMMTSLSQPTTLLGNSNEKAALFSVTTLYTPSSVEKA